jgi:hypothetical protein
MTRRHHISSPADSVDVLQLSASSHEAAATPLNQDAGLFPTDLDDIAFPT